MFEGFSSDEIADYSDAVKRRYQARQNRLKPPWETLSGFADAVSFRYAAARSWPAFPMTGDVGPLLKVLNWNAPMIPIHTVTRAIPCDELSFYK
jgi:hypothetical protein